MLETNVDDLNPELYSYVLEQLLSAGAQDAWLTPIVMKKGRPAVTVSVLCSPPRLEAACRRSCSARPGRWASVTAIVDKRCRTRGLRSRRSTVRCG